MHAETRTATVRSLEVEVTVNSRLSARSTIGTTSSFAFCYYACQFTSTEDGFILRSLLSLSMVGATIGFDGIPTECMYVACVSNYQHHFLIDSEHGGALPFRSNRNHPSRPPTLKEDTSSQVHKYTAIMFYVCRFNARSYIQEPNEVTCQPY